VINIAKIEAWALRIPLKVRFKHASAERSTTESVWVEVTDSEGVVGYGEGCPRPYVTSETLESCAKALRGWGPNVTNAIHSIRDLRDWVGARREDLDRAPAAWCALELAILDLFARRSAASIESILEVSDLTETFRYTAVLGDQEEAQFAAQLQKYLEWGFTAYKIKLGHDSRRNQAKMSRAGEAGLASSQVRADANNLWHSPADALSELKFLARHFWAIEEPLASGDFAGMRQLNEALGNAIILDESFARAAQFTAIAADPGKWVINLRVSKMGGLLRSLEIATLAGKMGVPLVIGAQVGETSLLTRAALTVAQFARTNLRGQEGAFGKHLLQTDVVEDPITFGPAGELRIDRSFSAPRKIVRPSAFLSPL
jgi:L-Ala-D/L-Glu epimerase